MKKIFFLVVMIVILAVQTSVYAAEDKGDTFSDVSGHWAENAINRLVSLNAISGYDDATFKPESNTTRAEFIKILVESIQVKKASGGVFDDTKEHWAQSYIETAVMQGIINQLEIGPKFKPDNYISRIDMITWMMRALKLEKLETGSPFTDAKISYGYATRAYLEKLIDGYINDNGELELRPEQFSTRAEAATIITRILDYKADPEAYKKSLEEKEGM